MINRRGPNRSTNEPTNGEDTPLTTCPSEYAIDTSARLHPKSSTKATRKTV